MLTIYSIFIVLTGKWKKRKKYYTAKRHIHKTEH